MLDTWFSSALWPFSTLGWPEATKELERFYPTSVLVTGFDIIFFWVARMMMMGLHFQHEVPFREVYIHALVRDEKGAKMSKSKGNVMDPLDIIDGVTLDALIAKRIESITNKAEAAKVAADTRREFPKGIPALGTDALRFFLAAMAAQGRDVKLSLPRIEGYRNFATKVWNASRFAEMNGCVRVVGFDPDAVRAPLNRWILGEASKAVAETSEAIEAFRFNDAANAVYRFVWNLFCDWHLELAKPVLQGGAEGPARAETQATIAYVLDVVYALLHPFMPFVTEELWTIKGEDGPPRAGMLALGPWPRSDFAIDRAAEAEIGWIVELVSEIRSVRSEVGVPAGSQLTLTLVQASSSIARIVDGLGRYDQASCAHRPARICGNFARRLAADRGARRTGGAAAGRGSSTSRRRKRASTRKSRASGRRSPRSTPSSPTRISSLARRRRSSPSTTSGEKPRFPASPRWKPRGAPRIGFDASSPARRHERGNCATAFDQVDFRRIPTRRCRDCAINPALISIIVVIEVTSTMRKNLAARSVASGGGGRRSRSGDAGEFEWIWLGRLRAAGLPVGAQIALGSDRGGVVLRGHDGCPRARQFPRTRSRLRRFHPRPSPARTKRCRRGSTISGRGTQNPRCRP